MTNITEMTAIFAPLLGFLIVGLFGRQMGDRASQAITCVLMTAAAVASILLFHDVVLQGHTHTLTLGDWISTGDVNIKWALRFDQLSVVMMCVVNIVSACVHVYSIGYMSHDSSIPRFMCYLSLFTFAMLMLVSADNLVQVFFGWEGVGLASYLLIGFWHEKPSANAASVKAFVVNRVGDLGLTLGILTTFMLFGSVAFDDIFPRVADYQTTQFTFLGQSFHALTLIGVLLFIGAMGKSAQLGLHTWLPDAMEGPTPVSALIHAATMVTAGVFLVARFSPLYEYAPDALVMVTVVGAATAFVAATIGLTQFDIKRVIAYSTMSQLGYMFFALGVSAYGAAIFHLVTHAFFKALLFLGAGSVIHAMSGEQDMRKMGGIWRKIPFTHAVMVIGSLALCGVPFLAGYYSKDTILESSWAAGAGLGHTVYWVGVAAAFMTAFYSWRLMSMTFYGASRADSHTLDHVHESPWSMKLPLALLAVGAIFSGAYFYGGMVDGYTHHAAGVHHTEGKTATTHDVEPSRFLGFGDWSRAEFWGHSIKVLPENDTVARAHDVPSWVKLTPTAIGLSGMILALLLYLCLPFVPERVARAFPPLYQLSFRKWYVDEVYDVLFVRTSRALGRVFWVVGDGRVIDGAGPHTAMRVTSLFGRGLSLFQTGYVFQYAFVMMIALVALLTYVVFKIGLFGG